MPLGRNHVLDIGFLFVGDRKVRFEDGDPDPDAVRMFQDSGPYLPMATKMAEGFLDHRWRLCFVFVCMLYFEILMSVYMQEALAFLLRGA